MSSNILQYESKIWATADLLRGSGIKESDWPACMMPFFALAMIESRLVRLIDDLKAEYSEEGFREMHPGDRREIIHDVGQGYNEYIMERNLLLRDICANDKTFEYAASDRQARPIRYGRHRPQRLDAFFRRCRLRREQYS